MPTQLLDALDIHKCAHDMEPLIIFFSTDQVWCSPAMHALAFCTSMAHLSGTKWHAATD